MRDRFMIIFIIFLLTVIFYQNIFDKKSVNYKSYDDCVLLALNGVEKNGVGHVIRSCENKFRKPPINLDDLFNKDFTVK